MSANADRGATARRAATNAVSASWTIAGRGRRLCAVPVCVTYGAALISVSCACGPACDGRASPRLSPALTPGRRRLDSFMGVFGSHPVASSHLSRRSCRPLPSAPRSVQMDDVRRALARIRHVACVITSRNYDYLLGGCFRQKHSSAALASARFRRLRGPRRRRTTRRRCRVAPWAW